MPSGIKVNVTGDTSFGASGKIELTAGAGRLPRYSTIPVNADGKACVSFQASAALVGTTLTTSYEVSGPGSTTTSNGILLISVATFQPANVTLEAVEDVAKELVLVGSKEGSALDSASSVTITALPSNGSLFYYSSPAAIGSVANIQNTLLSSIPSVDSRRVSATGQIEAAGGILFYKGNEDFSGSDTFAYTFPGKTAEGRVSVVVEKKNDAPVGAGMRITSAASAGSDQARATLITLGSRDVDGDPFPGARASYRITKTPELGKLYTVKEDGLTLDEPLLDSQSKSTTIQTFSHASRVVGFRTQYSYCAGTSPDSKCNFGSDDSCSAGATCVQQSYHASQVVGPPDVYPAYGDSAYACR